MQVALYNLVFNVFYLLPISCLVFCVILFSSVIRQLCRSLYNTIHECSFHLYNSSENFHLFARNSIPLMCLVHEIVHTAISVQAYQLTHFVHSNRLARWKCFALTMHTCGAINVQELSAARMIKQTRICGT